MSQYRQFGQKDEPVKEDGDGKFYGVNARLAPEDVPQGLLSDGLNVRMRDGDITPRRGVVKPGWLNVNWGDGLGPVQKFYGAGTFKDPNGQEWVILAADGAVTRCRPHNVPVNLPLPAGLAITAPCTFTQAFNKLFCFRGRYLQPLVLSSVDTGFTDLLPRWDASATYKGDVLDVQVAEEVAYGPFIALSSITPDVSAPGVAVAVTAVAHGYVTGVDVVIRGVTPSYYNGRATVTVVDDVTFRFPYPVQNIPGPATVQGTVSNMARYWKAIGTRVAVTSYAVSGGSVVATKNGHGFLAGQSVTVTGAAPPAYNGTWVISAADANTFTFKIVDVGNAPANTAPGLAQSSVVQAGQSPDTNPEAWQRSWDVLPNADDAVFMDNRLLVPTAYTPGADGYDSTSTYTKKDFIVAMDIGDNVHFLFQNEIRVNQGDDDEIIGLVKYNQDTAVVFKGKTWGVLSGLSGDLSGVSLDMRGDRYGCCADRGMVVAGKDVLFASVRRGICNLAQNELGQTRSVDVPFSNDLERIIGRINWSHAGLIRLAWWDDKLYCAVPLDDAAVRKVVPAPAETYPLGSTIGYTGLATGAQYEWVPGVNEDYLYYGHSLLLRSGGVFTAPATVVSAVSKYPTAQPGTVPYTGKLSRIVPNSNNAVLVYDFRATENYEQFYAYRNGAWAGVDQGSALCVQEWFQAMYNGELRLFYIGGDGWVNMIEESRAGDQIAGDVAGLGWEELEAGFDTRGYMGGGEGPKRWKRLEAAIGVWDCLMTIATIPGAAYAGQVIRDGVSFSRTKYLKPVGKADYVDGNVNGDFETPGRGNYSVDLVGGGVNLGGGISLGTEQEVIPRTSLRPAQDRYLQFRFRNTRGRFRVMNWGPSAAEGQRRTGIIV